MNVNEMKQYLQGLIEFVEVPLNRLTIEQIKAIGKEIKRTREWIEIREEYLYKNTKKAF